MTEITDTATVALLAAGAGYDPIEDRLRQNIRSTIEAVFEEELAAFIGRCRYGRDGGSKKGYRPGCIRGSSRPPTRRHVRHRNGEGAAGAGRGRRRQDDRMALESVGARSAADEEGRSADRLGLFGRDQHAPGRAGVVRSVRGRGQQGRGQPGPPRPPGRVPCKDRMIGLLANHGAR